MLINFCDPSLRTEVKCNTISTEGYDVENLVNKSQNGFMVYSCIKPPIHVDFQFICNIRISHIIIWPNVGAQKSSGFQIHTKSSDEITILYTCISNGYLNSSHSGIIFHRNDMDPSIISSPSNFLQCRLKSSNLRLVNYVNKLRISIVKTENSVSALGKVEIWGYVSPQCGKDVIATVCSLWSQRNVSSIVHNDNNKREESTSKNDNDKKLPESLEVPENFLDPITWEIMTQPIILPSGKVIDQSTLDKHEQNEAIWGRPSSDPFTGIPLSEIRRALAATALKAQIDKFLLENSNNEEVKKLPRVLGSKTRPESSLKLINSQKSQGEKLSNSIIQTSMKYNNSNNNNHHNNAEINLKQKKLHCHVLPLLPVKRKINLGINSSSVKKPNLNKNPTSLSTDNCDCCKNSIFYRLPCNHIVCRKILLSINNECNVCKMAFTNSDPQRIYK
ncbi:RING finger protein 37 [Leptopilina boulardi]|uniref:RING finger protein 37 n=1 Tax=Leptopilina boulardi TaxID=63433 RepID=UPI0021F5076C|nr:RING finger protein 37 [Leptopilina boulardi]